MITTGAEPSAAVATPDISPYASYMTVPCALVLLAVLLSGTAKRRCGATPPSHVMWDATEVKRSAAPTLVRGIAVGPAGSPGQHVVTWAPLSSGKPAKWTPCALRTWDSNVRPVRQRQRVRGARAQTKGQGG